MRILLATLHPRPSLEATPLAAACLAAALPANLRSRVRLLDFFPSMGPEAMREAILAERPDLVAFPLYVWNRATVLSLARAVRQNHSRVRLVAGGPEATIDPAGVLKEGDLDAVIRGEGELTFARLAECWGQGGSPADIRGVTWRAAEGDLTVNDPAAAPPLEELPSPWLSGILSPPAGGGVVWEISRAADPAGNLSLEGRPSSLRQIAPERLEAELDLFLQGKVVQIRVLAPAFNFPPERGKELLRLFSRRAPRQRFLLEGWAEFLDQETAQLLSRLPGVLHLDLQSFQPEVLGHLHRPFEPGLLPRNLGLLRAEGVNFQLQLAFGLPGDNDAGLRSSLNAALEFAPQRLLLSVLAVYPGTTLDRHRSRFGLLVQEDSPFQVLRSDTFTAEELQGWGNLAEAIRLFYNRGRAGRFLPTVLQAVEMDAATFFEGFVKWATGPGEVTAETLFSEEELSPAAILPLQEGYTEYRLHEAKKPELVPAALDLIRFHFHEGEAQLGEELVPPSPEALRGIDFWNTRWQKAPALRLANFTYEILDLLEMAEIRLEQFVSLFRPVGSVALFTRQGDQVFCESLEESMLRLLRGSDGQKAPSEIFSGSVPRQEAEEILASAVAEGLLIPA